MVERRQAADEFAKALLVGADQVALGAAFLGVAEQIERRAAQEFERREQPEGEHHARAVALFDGQALGVFFTAQWRCEVEFEAHLALELAFQLFHEGAIRVEAGDFILVLIRHELEKGAGNGFG